MLQLKEIILSATETFLNQLKSFGDAQAVVSGADITRYAELVEAAGLLWNQIEGAGIGTGDVVALHAPHSAQASAALLALAELKAISVPITNVPAEKRREFHDVGQVEWVIDLSDGSGEPHIFRTGRHADHDLFELLRIESAPGLVLFSSGTTGRSKASVLNLELMLSRYSERRAPQRILSFLNLDHIGGINTLLHTLSQGGAVITVPQRTPDEVFRTIERDRVSVLPTTPTFLTMTLISGAHLKYDTSTLKLLTYGTEPMPQQTLERIAIDLPNVKLKQTYGLSELGIMATKSKANDSLWIQLGGS